jgi:Spy/CpxP family protein refolding chaperone
MKIRVIAIAAAIILVIVAASPAQPHAAGARVLGKYLQLTPDQVTAWKQIDSDTAATIEPLVTQARDLRKQIAAATDPVEVGKLTVSLRAVGDQIRAARQSTKTKLAATLTPEQKTKYEAFEAAVAFLRAQRGRR